MIPFNMDKDKIGESVFIFITTEHIAVLMGEDNNVRFAELDPECPATFRQVCCLVKQTSGLFCDVLGHLLLIIKALHVFHACIIAAPQS